MDTTAQPLIEEINDMLKDFKADMIVDQSSRDEDEQAWVEHRIDFLVKEINDLFGSSYL